jgi:spermidine/putrescine ABC transporter ATP-binding subunit
MMNQMKTSPSITSHAVSTGALVDIRAIRHQFGTVEALKSIDISIRPGEFVALLGPSGCGKTTLLRCIAGLVTPTSGEILIDGRSITHVPIHKRDLGMVFQSYALFPHMTVADNIRFGLKMHGVRGAEADQRMAEALALVQMVGYEARYPAQMSGGQQQRIALARALVTRPKALLLDEPFGALDAKLRESMQIELRRLQKALGITTIFVTHDQQEALSMADRVAVMNGGRIEQLDTPARIYNAPTTSFVADFIGQTNRFSGSIESKDGAALHLRLDGSGQTIEIMPREDMKAGDRVIVMVRPERVQIAAAGMPSRDVALAGKVTDTVFVGQTLNVYAQTDIGPVVASVSNAMQREAKVAASGDSVTVSWDRDAQLIFRDA